MINPVLKSVWTIPVQEVCERLRVVLDRRLPDNGIDYVSCGMGEDEPGQFRIAKPIPTLKDGRYFIACYAVRGSSEGHYVHVELKSGTRDIRRIGLVKTFGGADEANEIARIAHDFLAEELDEALILSAGDERRHQELAFKVANSELKTALLILESFGAKVLLPLATAGFRCNRLGIEERQGSREAFFVRQVGSTPPDRGLTRDVTRREVIRYLPTSIGGPGCGPWSMRVEDPKIADDCQPPWRQVLNPWEAIAGFHVKPTAPAGSPTEEPEAPVMSPS
jgi:hypothetical protein